MNEHRFDIIDQKLDKIAEHLADVRADHADMRTTHVARLTKLETQQKGVITILTALMTAGAGFVAHLLHIKG